MVRSTEVTVFASGAGALTAQITPTLITIKVGGTATFTATASGGVPPYTCQWFLNNQLVSGVTESTCSVKGDIVGIHEIFFVITDSVNTWVISNKATLTVSVTGLVHTLNVTSDPSGIAFTLWDSDEGTQSSVITPYSSVLDEGNYILDMPKSVMIGAVRYGFQKWADGSIAPWRGVKLTADLTYKALYTITPLPTVPLPLIFVGASAIVGIFTILFGLKG